jgi:DNA-binding transcriptional ArsR family regulator
MKTRESPADQKYGCRCRVVHQERVKRARSQAFPESELERAALTFKVLGDPTRLKIFVALSEAEMCVCDLAAFLGLSESAVSHQLRRMREQAMVRTRRDGQVLYYGLQDGHVAEMLKLGFEHVREGPTPPPAGEERVASS